MKRTLIACLYTLDYCESRHQLHATSAADLSAQVQAITGSKQASILARAAWGDRDADLRSGGFRLIAVGAVVREVWKNVPQLKSHAGQDVVPLDTPTFQESPAMVWQAQGEAETLLPGGVT